MSLLHPFRGLRPVPALAAEVASPPYDVLDSEEARALAAGNPRSFLRVGKSEIDLPPGTDLYGEAVYARAAENLRALVADGTLVQDADPGLYIYTLEQGGHRQTGVFGTFSVEEYLAGTVRRHELTRKDKEDDRTRHVQATNAQTGPAFLTYVAEPALDALVATLAARDALCDFTAADGIRHRLVLVDAPDDVAALVRAFAALPMLYIADGHHRSAAAMRVYEARKAANPAHRGDEEYAFFLACAFPHDQLRILPYNRAVKDLAGLDAAAFLARLAPAFRAEPTALRVPEKKGQCVCYLPGGRWLLTFAGEVPTDPAERLDVSLLQRHCFQDVLGIDDPRTDKRITFIGGARGDAELERLVASGDWAAAFALHPTSLDDLIGVAGAGQIMPPKSTWFEPKLRDGLVTHLLD